MVKAVALNTVHVCKEPGVNSPEGRVTKRAVVDVVRPGQMFDVDDRQFDEFEASGAARKATRADAAAANESGMIPLDEAVPIEVSLEKTKK